MDDDGKEAKAKPEKKERRKRRGRGEGAIFQRGNGQWCAAYSAGYTAEGKRRRRWLYGATKKEVQGKLDKVRNYVGAGRPLEVERITVAKYMTDWLEGIKARGRIKPTTAARYEQFLRLHIIEHLGGEQVSKLTALHVESLTVKMAQAGKSLDAQAKALIILGAALRKAVKKGILFANPVRELEREDKPKPTRKEIQPLDAEQAQRFLAAAAGDRLYALYEVALHCGCRQGELFGLQWEDVDWTAGTLQVQHSLEELRGVHRLKDVKTKQGRRRIDLSPSVVAILHEHRKRMMAEGNAGAPIFCDRQGGWLRKSNVVRRSFKSIIKRADEKCVKDAAKVGGTAALLPPIRFHDLRHSCASLLLKANVHPKIVSERLGHAKVSITLDIYSHLLPTMQAGASAQLEALLHKKQTPADGRQANA